MAISDPFNSTNTQTCQYGNPSASVPGYDDLARLISANCGSSLYDDTFSYDAFGNLTKSGTSQFQPGYNWQTNQMTASGDSYDANGDVLNDNSHTYAWDSEGRPTSITNTTITYDALDRQVEQDNAGTYTQTAYDPMGNRFANMNTIRTLNTAPVLLPAGAQAVYVGGLDYYKHADWEGSARFFSTPNQTMWGDVAYGPYGEIYGPNSGTYTFTGQIQEHTFNNLYRFMYREYRTQGRWPSPDPAGVAAANPANPQSWNRYAYVLNNPLLFVDPMGLCQDGVLCIVTTACDQPGFEDTVFCSGAAGGGAGGGAGSGKGCTFLAGPVCSTGHFVLNPLNVSPVPPQAPGPQFQLTPQPTKPSCASVFFSTAADDLKNEVFFPFGQGPEAAATATATAGAMQYTISKGLAYPLKSSIVRGILDLGETASVAIVGIPVLIAGSKGLAAEFDSNRAGTCSTVF